MGDELVRPPVSYPGVYVQEAASLGHSVVPAPTSTTAFLGRCADGPVLSPTGVSAMTHFEATFGTADSPVAGALRDYFSSGGGEALIVRVTADGSASAADYQAGLDALAAPGRLPANLLVIPPDTPGGDTDPTVYGAAAEWCAEHRAFLITDCPSSWGTSKPVDQLSRADIATDLGIDVAGQSAAFAATYFPRVMRDGASEPGPCSGLIAGLYARTDNERGVWNAPAGTTAWLPGVGALAIDLSDEQNGALNSNGINCLRTFTGVGPVVWGARTLAGVGGAGAERTYVNVRRLLTLLQDSLEGSLRWTAFEANDPTLWDAVRAETAAFLTGLWKEGALIGSKPSDAFQVQCDRTTTTQADIERGICNLVVKVALRYPAEFTVLFVQLNTAAA